MGHGGPGRAEEAGVKRAMDDDEVVEIPTTATGSIALGSWQEEDRPVGRIIVPDPDTRSGWGAFHVYRPRPKPTTRPAGFGRP